MQEIQRAEKRKRIRRVAAAVYEWVGAMVMALSVLVVLFTFFIRVVGVDGDSMEPSLENKNRLILSCVSDSYTPGNIVVINRYTKEPLIKRVIATAGDTLRITESGLVFVNGELQSEPYIQGSTVLRDFSGSVTIPDGYMFVMGDNRSISLDSRSAEVGMVSSKDVVGKVVFRLWPLTEFGGVYSNLNK